MQIGRRIYYDIVTGNVLVDTEERQGSVRPTTVEQDIQTYYALHSRVRESYNYIELEFGRYAQDFAECNGYRIEPTTRQIEFSYPDDGIDGPSKPSEPVYQKPLSEQVAQLQQENTLLKAQNSVLVERTDFHEEVLSEIILTITS